MRHLNRAVLLVGFVVTMAACTPKEPEPPVPEAPPPPTALEIRQEITQPALPVVEQYNRPWKDLKDIPEGVMFNAMQQMRAAKQKHITGENGEEGIRQAGSLLEEQLQAAYANEAWPLTWFLWRALNNVTPARAGNFMTYRDRAMTFTQMPRPSVTGFFAQGDSPVVFLDVFLPKDNRTEKVRVREGEEFNGMLLVEIKGNNRGAIVEHLDTGELLDLDYGPASSR